MVVQKGSIAVCLLATVTEFRPICVYYRFRHVVDYITSWLFAFWLQLWLLFLAITLKSAQNYDDFMYESFYMWEGDWISFDPQCSQASCVCF